VLPLKILFAGIVAGVLVNVTGYIVVGRLFHGYQSRTPGTWRTTESWHHYLYSSAIRVLACIGIAALHYYFGSVALPYAAGTISNALVFGTCVWAVAILPLVTEAALFVNWHRGFVVGLLLDWLVICIIASAAAAVAARAV
jgi:hypothetical protein